MYTTAISEHLMYSFHFATVVEFGLSPYFGFSNRSPFFQISHLCRERISETKMSPLTLDLLEVGHFNFFLILRTLYTVNI